MNETMTTVRQAHRYVVAYQRRILDSLNCLNDQLRDLAYMPGGWAPLYCKLAAAKSFAPARWAWDFTPLYAARFYWEYQGRNENEAGASFFMVDHVVDTAFETKSTPVREEPDPLVDLLPAAQSDSVLRARWIYLGTAVSPALWQLDWDVLVPKLFECDLAEVWPFELTSAPRSLERDGIVAGGHVVSIATLDEGGRFGTDFVAPVVAELRRISANR